ncbi:interleukin-1 receptor-like 2 [Aulostomus maculatus]
MGLSSKLGVCLFFLGLREICGGSLQENCTNYKVQFGRVFTVPGDVAMLNSTLLSPEVFNFTSVPYNISWYNSKTSRELSNQTGRILVQGMTLWFLNVTLEDEGEYVTILRTPSKCYRQVTKMMVEQPAAGECGRPQKAGQILTSGVVDILSCPLKDYMTKLESYNITSSIKWYRDCDLIEDGSDRYAYWDKFKLKVDKVKPDNSGFYTCTLTFTLGGITGSVSETIDAWVKEEHSGVPQVHKPANQIIKAQIGSNFRKECLVFVPCVGKTMVDIFWVARDDLIMSTNPSDHIYTTEMNKTRDVQGVWLKRLLVIRDLSAEDFHINYTCRAFSDRGVPAAYFTLLPADPDITPSLGLGLAGVTVLILVSVWVYYRFKIDIVLLLRRSFPIFYTNEDSDGKLYDAYVAYPRQSASGFSGKVDSFALHTLPQVLENACGYKLYIAGRDCQPGQAIADSVEEMRWCRRLLLLYTASTFNNSISSHYNNNNISKTNFDSSNEETFDPRQHLEYVLAMHKTLLEGSLKVVLVELEEVTPAQLALFPETVQHLRRKQGAVCWWKNQRTRQRWRTCVRKQDEEKYEHEMPSPSPYSRFWKEIRYYMPASSKRVVYPEKVALLNL